MSRFALLLASIVGLTVLLPQPALAASWGSPYGDPPGFCPAQSFLPATYTVVVTSDPLVGTNPEQDTFWGIHPYPGYDEWYGYWYGDFRGVPGDASGWRYVTTSWYGQRRHWNFASWGWAVHGHAKQYVGYHNWTFGGQCRIGWYGAGSPPPYMADVYGYPVADIYVDSVPPNPPQPRVTAVSPSSVAFTWDPVSDRGDGAGADYWAAGFDHFTSWLTVGNGAAQQVASTPAPRLLVAGGLAPGQVACVHVIAADRLGNQTPDLGACAQPVSPPPLPSPPTPSAVGVSPSPAGLTGLDAWLWLSPAPATLVTTSVAPGVIYSITARPVSVAWSYGDDTSAVLPAPTGFGARYPVPSPVSHVYERETAAGYAIAASVTYSLTWTATYGGITYGPYPLGSQTVPARGLSYPVRQAQAEVTEWR